VTSSRAELRSYYEAEAEQGSRGPLSGKRVVWRDEFIERLQSEGRSSVVDFGAGPGFDVAAFCECGLQAIGLDLAVGNAVLARQSDRTVLPADIAAPPLRTRSFDAAWSMSTIMHLPDEQATQALAAMVASTVPGAPIRVGVWGGNGEVRIDEQIPGERRPFYGRTVEANSALFDSIATIESVVEHPIGPNGYQVFDLRTPAA